MKRLLPLLALFLLSAIPVFAQAGGYVSPAAGSSSGGAPANSPQLPAQQQGPAYNVRNYGAIGDAKSSRNCASTATTTITSTDNPWVAGDVGKKMQMVVTAISNFGTTTGGNANNEVTITGFNSAGSVVVSAAATQSNTGTCVWYTQQEQTAMLAAYSAADTAASKAGEPGYQSPTKARPGQVFIPAGGYVVCGTIYNDLLTHTQSNTEGVSLIGEPGVDIYVAPCFVPPAGATGTTGTLIILYQNQRTEIGKFAINGMGMLAGGFSNNTYLVGALSSGKTNWHDIFITDYGNSSTTSAVIGLNNGSGLSRWENIVVQNSPVADKATACLFTGNVGIDIYNSFCSNHFTNWFISGSGQRTPVAPHFAIHGAQGDECNQVAGTGCAQLVNSTVNCFGCEFLNPGGGTPSWSVDTNSSLYLTDSYASSYNVDGGNSCAVTLAGNGALYSTASNFAGNNTSASVCGPSTAKFVDLGGNQWFNQVAGVLTACTAANFGTCAFSGGIVPKATVTHTPNTCYAVTGNLLATAQNICTFLNDQNYQVLNITAQSGGTTPTNSSCATPPVITLSDGTRTATLTMTTGKTAWSSAVDGATVGSVFASGTTLTISIGANTCATPPVNVAVSYVLQSVLNP